LDVKSFTSSEALLKRSAKIAWSAALVSLKAKRSAHHEKNDRD
jgi:hypothetical protein